MKSFLKDWENMRPTRVAILGAGVSGLGVASLLDRLEWKYETYDEQGRVFTKDEARTCSFVVFSPGFKLNHPWIEMGKNLGKHVISEMDFGAAFCENKIVAVTGTNGKTTLSTLLSHVWKKNGCESIVAGNVGKPLTQAISESVSPESTIFLETSSFQAQSLKILKPDSVIWNNFEPDHLDHHDSITEYFLAKANLLRQLKPNELAWLGSSVVEFGQRINHEFHCRFEKIEELPLTANQLSQIPFLNTFPQRKNLALAKRFSEKNGIEESNFFSAIRSYKPQPGRLKKIAEVAGISFWNDSKATNSSAVLNACRNFTDKILWIGGGREKGAVEEVWIREIKKYVKQAFLIGEVAPKIHRLLSKERVQSTVCRTLSEATILAFEKAVDSIDVVFSPGFSSFDMFDNYLDRGNSFDKVVFDLKRQSSQTTQVYLT